MSLSQVRVPGSGRGRCILRPDLFSVRSVNKCCSCTRLLCMFLFNLRSAGLRSCGRSCGCHDRRQHRVCRLAQDRRVTGSSSLSRGPAFVWALSSARGILCAGCPFASTRREATSAAPSEASRGGNEIHGVLRQTPPTLQHRPRPHLSPSTQHASGST